MARGAASYAGAYRAMVGLAALLVAGALTGCDAATSIPAAAHQVQVTTAGGEVRISPSTVPAGEVYLVFESDPVTQHVDVEFVHRGGPLDSPAPLSDEDLALLAQDTNPAGLSYESGFGSVHRVTLAVGGYAFRLAESLAVLDVTP